jgi:transposase InsO family protein
MLLGYEGAESTVASYMPRRGRRPQSHTWRTFLQNHLRCTAACDFFVVPTATFRLLFCFLVLSHDRRRILHFKVTAHPTAAWTAQQIREAFPGDGTESQFGLRDRDGAYGAEFRGVVRAIGTREILTAPQSPWQNPYAERLIGSIRRERFDHLIILNESYLRRILKEYILSYNESRPHLSLAGDAPDRRDVEPARRGPVVANPVLGGLHHRYRRAA